MANPIYAPYARLPKGECYEEYLYAIEISNGVMKVGRTHCPRNRVKQHAKEIMHDGKSIRRFAVVRTFGTNSFYQERELLMRLNRLATVRPGRLEHFTGVSFATSAQLMRQCASREFISLHVRTGA